MKRVAAWLLLLLMLTGAFTATPANSEECFLDMSGAVGIFGFDGTTNTLFISNMRFLNRSFTYSWKLNLTNGSWEIVGAGGAATGRGGLIDFSSAAVQFSGCVDMVIRNFRFIGQSFTACWRLDTFSGDWTFGSLGDTCAGAGQPGGRTSTVTGKVTNATMIFNAQIEGAVVRLRSGESAIYSGTTDASGMYSISNVLYGSYILEVQASGYATHSRSVTVDEPTERFDVALSPGQPQSNYRIVLNWGQTPLDLDAHLLVPAALLYPNGYIIGWQGYRGIGAWNMGAENSYPWAMLDVDDVDGYGPETITIHRLTDGRYRYFVHLWIDMVNPNDVNISTTPLTGSESTVTLYRGNAQIGSWNVPISGAGRYWHVFDLDGSTAAVTDVNIIQSTAASAF